MCRIQKEEDLISALPETTSTSSSSYGSGLDVKGVASGGYSFEAGALYGLDYFVTVGFAVQGDNIGLDIQGEGALALWLYDSFYFGYSLVGMADLYFVDYRGRPGWGITGGYGYMSSIGSGISENFWRIGIRKYNLYDSDLFSGLLYVDFIDRIGWRIGWKWGFMADG
jgi:hypothetical protein